MNDYATPRMTRDIDMVLELDPDDVTRLVDCIERKYYVPSTRVRQAASTRTMFNVIHQESFIKADCIIRKDTDYRSVELTCRSRVEIVGFSDVSGEQRRHDSLEARLGEGLSFVVTIRRREKPARYRLRRGWRVGGSPWVSNTYLRSCAMRDTPADVQKMMHDLIMAMPADERFIRGALMFDAARAIVLASLDPELEGLELKRALYARIYGEPLPDTRTSWLFRRPRWGGVRPREGP